MVSCGRTVGRMSRHSSAAAGSELTVNTFPDWPVARVVSAVADLRTNHARRSACTLLSGHRIHRKPLRISRKPSSQIPAMVRLHHLPDSEYCNQSQQCPADCRHLVERSHSSRSCEWQARVISQFNKPPAKFHSLHAYHPRPSAPSSPRPSAPSSCAFRGRFRIR